MEGVEIGTFSVADRAVHPEDTITTDYKTNPESITPMRMILHETLRLFGLDKVPPLLTRIHS